VSVCFRSFDEANSGSGGAYETAFQVASAHGKIDVVRLLLENKNKANVTVEGEWPFVKIKDALTLGIQEGSMGRRLGRLHATGIWRLLSSYVKTEETQVGTYSRTVSLLILYA